MSSWVPLPHKACYCLVTFQSGTCWKVLYTSADKRKGCRGGGAINSHSQSGTGTGLPRQRPLLGNYLSLFGCIPQNCITFLPGNFSKKRLVIRNANREGFHRGPQAQLAGIWRGQTHGMFTLNDWTEDKQTLGSRANAQEIWSTFPGKGYHSWINFEVGGGSYWLWGFEPKSEQKFHSGFQEEQYRVQGPRLFRAGSF